MSDENDGSGIPLEESLIEEEVKKPLTEKDIELMKELDAREKKLLYIKPAGKILENEAAIIVTDESHGFCNVVKRYLLKNPKVLFASYKKEFYVDPMMFINTEGVNALDALLEASDKLYVDLQELKKMVDSAVK
ncbi:MAG: RpoL/Rpb11 RNA polymerase subunit family protein [Candidatus Hodarchaeota archaeon]